MTTSRDKTFTVNLVTGEEIWTRLFPQNFALTGMLRGTQRALRFWTSSGNSDVVHASLGYRQLSWFKQEVENFLISYFTNILCYVAVMAFNFLRKSIAGIYVSQLTVIKRLKLIVDKNCETVSASCDMSTLTEVAILTGVKVLIGSPTLLYISYKTKNTH